MKLQHEKSLHLALRGLLNVGDPLLLEAIELSTDKVRTTRLNKQVFRKNLAWKHNVFVNIYKTSDGYFVVLNLAHKKLDEPLFNYDTLLNKVSHDDSVKVTHKTLNTETKAYNIYTDNGVIEVSLLSNGQFGEVWSAKDNVMMTLHFNHPETTIDSIVEDLNRVLAPNI